LSLIEQSASSAEVACQQLFLNDVVFHQYSGLMLAQILLLKFGWHVIEFSAIHLREVGLKVFKEELLLQMLLLLLEHDLLLGVQERLLFLRHRWLFEFWDFIEVSER